MENEVNSEVTEGWLLKWTTYIKGYRKRYFVLENGLLSYYSQPEMKYIACRTTINLSNAIIIFPKNRAYFVLAEGSKRFYLKCLDESDKSHWKSAILLWKSNHQKISGLLGDSDSMSEGNTYHKDTSRDEKSQSNINGGGYRMITTKRQKKKSFQRRSIDYANDSLSENSNQQSVRNCFSSTNGISEIRKPLNHSVMNDLNVTSSSSAVNNIQMNPPTRKSSSNNWFGGLKMLNCMSSARNSAVDRRVKRRIHGSEPSINRTINQSVENMDSDILNKNSLTYRTSIKGTEWDIDKLDLSNEVYQLDEKALEVQKQFNQLVDMIENPSEKVKDSIANVQLANRILQDSTSEILTRWSDKMQRFQKRLHDELRHRETLEKAIEQLARQHTLLESQMINNTANEIAINDRSNSCENPNEPILIKANNILKTCNRQSIRYSDDISTDTFYDAESFQESIISNEKIRNNCTKGSHSSLDSLILRLSSDTEADSDENDNLERNLLATNKRQSEAMSDIVAVEKETNLKTRRMNIPHKPRYSLNLWSVLKNSIGKELTKLPLPVNFNEPLSVLQRATEDLIYSKLLDNAAECGRRKDIILQMAYVAAFSVSSYAATADRTGKPFNPMLGETYECDRTMEKDQEWRSMSEQVSHHPPVMAFYAESPKQKWLFRQDLMLTSKFRGKYLSVTPKGSVCIKFGDGNSYTWNKVTTTVHNIIVGRLWIDNYGEAEIINKATGHVCKLTYHSHSYFAKENRLILGSIYDPNGKIVYSIKGNWDKELIGWPVGDEKKVLHLWTAIPPRQDADQIYNFNDMSVQLNEMEDGIAPTDSRLRPDQRLMEEGHWDEANSLKEILEQNQRERRALWEANDHSRGKPYSPLWFKSTFDAETQQDCYEFTGKYWEKKESGDWSECPNIFER